MDIINYYLLPDSIRRLKLYYKKYQYVAVKKMYIPADKKKVITNHYLVWLPLFFVFTTD